MKGYLHDIIAVVFSFFGFMASYMLEVTINNSAQYIAVCALVLVDGIFGIIAGVKREGFMTFKAIRLIKNLFSWVIILTTLLLAEMAFPSIFWLSETIMTFFAIFQIISTLKNASMSGFIKSDTVNELLDKIDPHKGDRRGKKLDYNINKNNNE